MKPTEIDNACSDAIFMGDSKAACEKQADSFNERFANTNRPARLIERFEKGSWAHGVTENLPVEHPVISPLPHIAIEDEGDIMPSQASPRRKRKASDNCAQTTVFDPLTRLPGRW